MYNIGWDDFDSHGYNVIVGDQHYVGLPNNDPLPDGDLIYLPPDDGAQFGLPGNQVELVLEPAQDVTWHKYLAVTDGGAVTYGRIDLENGSHGPNFITVPAQSPFVILSKAKFLGVWTAIYQTPTVDAYACMHLTFVWSKG